MFNGLLSKKLVNKFGFKRIVPCRKSVVCWCTQTLCLLFVWFAAVVQEKTTKNPHLRINKYSFSNMSRPLRFRLRDSKRLNTVRYHRHLPNSSNISLSLPYICYVDLLKLCLVFVWFAISNQKLSLTCPRWRKLFKSSPSHDEALPFRNDLA